MDQHKTKMLLLMKCKSQDGHTSILFEFMSSKSGWMFMFFGGFVLSSSF